MRARVAEHVLRPRAFAPKVLVRVDLHGVSVFGPGDRKTLLRWEWIERVDADREVTVRSPRGDITLPRRAFGLRPAELAALLEDARAIERRPDVIGRLSGG